MMGGPEDGRTQTKEEMEMSMMPKSTTSRVFQSSIIVLMTTLCLLSSVHSQTTDQSPDPIISNTVGIGVQGGYHICHEADLAAPYLNVLARIRLGSILGLEGAIGYRGEQRFSFISDQGEDFSAKVHSIPATGSLILFIPLAPAFTPYCVGGLGAHYMILDYSADINTLLADRSKVRFGYHLGFGFEVPLNSHVVLVGDYRYQFIDNAFEKELQFDFSSTSYRSSAVAGGIIVYF